LSGETLPCEGSGKKVETRPLVKGLKLYTDKFNQMFKFYKTLPLIDKRIYLSNR